MGFFLDGKQNYVMFHYYMGSKLCKYSTKIKIDRSEWDLKTQRPKARRGKTGEANRNITHELNEYQRAYDLLKSKYKESLTKEIVVMLVPHRHKHNKMKTLCSGNCLMSGKTL